MAARRNLGQDQLPVADAACGLAIQQHFGPFGIRNNLQVDGRAAPQPKVSHQEQKAHQASAGQDQRQGTPGSCRDGDGRGFRRRLFPRKNQVDGSRFVERIHDRGSRGGVRHGLLGFRRPGDKIVDQRPVFGMIGSQLLQLIDGLLKLPLLQDGLDVLDLGLQVGHALLFLLLLPSLTIQGLKLGIFRKFLQGFRQIGNGRFRGLLLDRFRNLLHMVDQPLAAGLLLLLVFHQTQQAFQLDVSRIFLKPFFQKGGSLFEAVAFQMATCLCGDPAHVGLARGGGLLVVDQLADAQGFRVVRLNRLGFFQAQPRLGILALGKMLARFFLQRLQLLPPAGHFLFRKNELEETFDFRIPDELLARVLQFLLGGLQAPGLDGLLRLLNQGFPPLAAVLGGALHLDTLMQLAHLQMFRIASGQILRNNHGFPAAPFPYQRGNLAELLGKPHFLLRLGLVLLHDVEQVSQFGIFGEKAQRFLQGRNGFRKTLPGHQGEDLLDFLVADLPLPLLLQFRLYQGGQAHQPGVGGKLLQRFLDQRLGIRQPVPGDGGIDQRNPLFQLPAPLLGQLLRFQELLQLQAFSVLRVQLKGLIEKTLRFTVLLVKQKALDLHQKPADLAPLFAQVDFVEHGLPHGVGSGFGGKDLQGAVQALDGLLQPAFHGQGVGFVQELLKLLPFQKIGSFFLGIQQKFLDLCILGIQLLGGLQALDRFVQGIFLKVVLAFLQEFLGLLPLEKFFLLLLDSAQDGFRHPMAAVDFQDLRIMLARFFVQVLLQLLLAPLQQVLDNLRLQAFHQAVQLHGQVFAVGVAMVGLLGQGALDNAFQHRRAAGQVVGKRRSGLVDDFEKNRGNGIPGKGPLPGQKLEQNDPYGKQVGTPVNPLRILDLLRGHVVHRPHDQVGPGHVGPGDPGNPEIHDLHFPAGKDAHIGRFYVAVNDAMIMGIMKPAADLGDDVQLLQQVVGDLLPDDLLQVHPFQKLHGNERDSVFFPQVVNGNDIGMAQVACRLSFPVEALQKAGVVLKRGGHGFDRHQPSQEGILRFINNSHGALAQLREDLIFTDFFYARFAHGISVSKSNTS